MTVRQIKAALKAKRTVMQTASCVVDGEMRSASWPIMGVMTQGGQVLVQSLYQPGQWYVSKGSGADISIKE